MPTVFALFAIVAIPILFFMLTWVVVTACRIFFPEKPQLVEHEGVFLREKAAREGVSIPVGAREIREDQRHGMRSGEEANYHYLQGDSEGLPVSWFEELQNRRN